MIVKPLNALILFIILFMSGSVIGNLLYMNPLVSGLYAGYTGHPGIKPWQEFGSIRNFVMLNMTAGVVLTALYIVLFSLFRSGLPAHPLIAGLLFGVLIILVKAVPEAWNQYLNINYPVALIMTQLINSSVGLLATGAILGLAWLKWPAVVPGVR